MFPTSIKPTSLKLTYFDIEGVAEPVRLALALAGVPFEDVRVKFPDWPELKPKTPYGQLPILQIDDNPEVMTQSGAMLRYCGKVFTDSANYGSLYPDDKLYEIEQVIGLVTDLNNAFTPALSIAIRPILLGYAEGFQSTDEGKLRTEQLRTTFCESILPIFLAYFDDMLQKSQDYNKKNGASDSDNYWLVPGTSPTIADCFAVPYLRRYSRGYIDYIPSNCLETHPRVVQYLERFCALPEIQGRYPDGIGGVGGDAN